jgi:hypothetical protein
VIISVATNARVNPGGGAGGRNETRGQRIAKVRNRILLRRPGCPP